MMTPSTVQACRQENRRADLRRRGPNGIDYIEVREENYQINVFLFRTAPADLTIANVVITGGGARHIRVIELRLYQVDDPERDDSLQLTLDHPGDASTHTLRLADLDEDGQPTDQPFPGMDPRYAQAEFRFVPEVPSLLDCRRLETCPPQEPGAPEISYLAKDYGTFRQLILDRLALTMPDWQERHEPDIGIVLVELFAYVADYLSYYQDAVATEAYLSTARQRISVRRHVRLVDYSMHEGCNARAWVSITADQDVTDPPIATADISFLAAYDGPLPPSGTNLRAARMPTLRDSQCVTFQPVSEAPLLLYAAHNRISFYTWGDELCCLPAGATQATLLDQDRRPAAGAEVERKLHLQVGDVLLLEEVIGPATGSPDDADPEHRHLVRLTRIELSEDSLYGTRVVEVEWSREDALPFALCLSTIGLAPDCVYIADVSVARGNVTLADQGSWVPLEDLGTVPLADAKQSCAGIASASEVTVAGRTFHPVLRQAPLTYSAPLATAAPASGCLLQDPRAALPEILVQSIPGLPAGSGPLFTFEELADPASFATRLGEPPDLQTQNLRAELPAATLKLLSSFNAADPDPQLLSALAAWMAGHVRRWTVQRDLLSSSAEDFDFVVEMDEHGVAHVRFGDGECGRAPGAGETFAANYRIGNGPSGNVGAETMFDVVLAGSTLYGGTLTPRNPLAAQGGTPPESVDVVKLLAPGALQQQIERAITAEDYAALAERNPMVQRAAAELQWTGSRYEVHVAIDPYGTERRNPSLPEEIQKYLYRYRRIGHEVVVVSPEYVPLDIAMRVELHPKYDRAHLQPLLLDIFSDRTLATGALGLFHPDSLTFGQAIYLSALVNAAQSVPGVRNVKVTRLQRLFNGPNGELQSGVLAIGPLEIPRLDNHPGRPDHGRFSLELRGGR